MVFEPSCAGGHPRAEAVRKGNQGMGQASPEAWPWQPQPLAFTGTEPVSAPRAMTLRLLGAPGAAGVAVHLLSLPRLRTSPSKDVGSREAWGCVEKLHCITAALKTVTGAQRERQRAVWERA